MTSRGNLDEKLHCTYGMRLKFIRTYRLFSGSVIIVVVVDLPKFSVRFVAHLIRKHVENVAFISSS